MHWNFSIYEIRKHVSSVYSLFREPPLSLELKCDIVIIECAIPGVYRYLQSAEDIVTLR